MQNEREGLLPPPPAPSSPPHRTRSCVMLVMPAIVVVLVAAGVACFLFGAVFRWPANAGMVVLQVALGLTETGLAVMTLWSFYAVCFTDPGSPENDDWMKLPSYSGRPVEDPGQEEVPRLREERVVRYCRHCKAWKPDRAHHCRQLGRCVLRMDHFCPWVGTTVGWRWVGHYWCLVPTDRSFQEPQVFCALLLLVRRAVPLHVRRERAVTGRTHAV